MQSLLPIEPRHIEGVGLFILLITFYWQFHENEIAQQMNNTEVYYIHEKLNAIWNIVHLPEKNYENKLKIYEGLNENWQEWQSNTPDGYARIKAHKTFRIERIVCYIVGSLVLIFSKFCPKKIYM